MMLKIFEGLKEYKIINKYKLELNNRIYSKINIKKEN